jgi:hypothetical protein
MDTSKEFIEMVKASGIKWEWKIGDWVVFDVIGLDESNIKSHTMVVVEVGENEIISRSAFSGGGGMYEKHHLIPIPRLDQLGEMHGIEAWSVHRDMPIHGVPGEYWCNVAGIADTAEKALLRRYMWIFQKKEWNGREWVKI